jgi:hypothetical protein
MLPQHLISPPQATPNASNGTSDEANVDPMLLNGDNKAAYDIAGDMRKRDAFRVARHILEVSPDSNID